MGFREISKTKLVVMTILGVVLLGIDKGIKIFTRKKLKPEDMTEDQRKVYLLGKSIADKSRGY